MDALLDCIDEIALDGLDGCPIQHLWRHLEERKPPFPLKLDDTAKQFLWKAIVGIPEVEFFVLPEPYAHIFGTQYDDSSDKDKLKSKNPLDQFQGPLKECNPFKLVCDQESGVRGSCPSYFVRKNVTQEIRDQAEYLSLETSYQRWGDCLVMVASQELREKALLGLHCDPNITLVDMQYCLLEHVGQARYNGRMQRAIGSNFVKTDPKTIFHHLKKLRKEHLITMQPVVITTSVPSSKSQSVRNYNTNIIRLKRFHIQEHHKYDILAASLCKLLLDAPNQELSLFDIQKHTSESKGTLKKVRQFLQQAGYVEEKKVGSTSKTGDEDFQPPKKKKKESLSTPTAQTIKIRLLKPFILRSDSILQPSDEEEEDEDGDDDDNEKDSQGDDYLSNLVAERPVFNQVYDLICQAGSRGYTLRKCQQACKLPFLDVRALVKDMKNRNLIEEVQQDIAKTKINWIVATPFVESNVQTIKVKQMQDQLKQMETKAIEAQAIGGFHAPSEGLDVEERKPVKSKSLIAERVTYRKLKRKHLILEFMENLKVVEGLFPIQKAILVSEEEEGHEGKIDRKVLIRMLDDLIAQGLIRKMTTVIHHGADSQTVDLYLHSSITNDHLAIAQTIEQCRERMRGECYKAEEKQEKKARQMAVEKEKRKLEKAEEKEKKKLQKEKEAQRKAQQEQDKEASKKTVKEQSTAINLNNELPSRKYGFLPRFSRAQALHELLWLLSCDDVTKEILDSADESQMNIDLEGSSDDEWMKHLKPMTKVCDAQGQPLKGWFRFSDVFPVMPLNILCKAVDVTDEIVGLDEYALDPVKKNTLICDLPQPLRSRVTEYRKIRSSAMELLFVMSQMGLVTPALPFPYNFKDIKMFLSKGVKLLDTTSSVRHYHTARPPEGKSFTLRSHMFTSMASVKNYWADLKCVCLNTPLGLVRNQEGSGDNKVVVASKNRKLNSFAKEEIDEDWVGLPPGDQLGAGGLDRSLFSHLQKNWTRMAKPRVTIQEKRKLPLSTTIMAAEAEALNSGSSLPQDSEKRFFSLGTAETKKQAKKGREQTKKRKRKADSQESDQVKKRRTASTEKAKNSEEKKSQPHHFRKTGHLAAIDEEDRNVLARKATERISFSPEEDTWLLLFRVALAVMKNETSRFYPFVCMRNILHKACTESFDKTAPSIQRRILRLMKNPHSQMTVKICSIECAHDESFQGFDDPKAEFEATFQEVVRRLRQKFSSSSLSCDGDLPLVSSLKELHDKFKVQALVSKDTMLSDQSIISLGPGIKSVSDINKAAIRDQIQIAFTTPQEMYDAYRVFQMFNSFTREELEDVFKEMQKKNLVSRKKSGENPSKQFTRALPFASITFQLSIAYHRLFLQGFKLITFFRDCKNFWDQLVKGEQHTLQEPRISSSSSSAITNEQTPEVLTPGTLEVKPKSTLGGHVACILSLLTTDKVTVEVRIPDEILNMDPSELTESAENIDTQQQTRQETTDPTAVTSSVSSKQKSSTLSPVKTKALEKAAERSQLSSSTGQSSSSSGKLPAERSETRSAMSSAKAKPQKKGKPGAGTSVTMEKRLHVREVFTLNSPASVTTKFTSAYNLSSVKEKNDYLTSCIEAVEVEQSTSQTVCKVATVPVASLSYNNTSSRSSRTALMLARGGKDPYVSINQLTARAVNTHDFMTLYPCGNVLRIKDDNDGKVPNEKGFDEKSVEKTEVMSVTKSSDVATATPEQSLQKANVLGADSMKSQGASQIVRTSSVCGDSVTAPVLISSAVSLEDYIEQKKRELGFNEMDAALANDIYDLVGEGKEFGVPVTRLQERVHKSHEQKLNSSKYSFEQHVKFLCAAKLLYKVGLYERCLVTASFVKPWSITLLKSISGSQQTLLKAAEPGKDDEEKSLPYTSDSLNTKKNTSNQEEDAESNNSQGIYQGDKNDLQITEIITEDTTSEASQDDSLTAKVINECSATSSPDTDSTHDENNETTDTKGVSSDRLGDLPSKQVDESKARRKKSKISNYESYSVVCRPWITIDGTTSQQLLRMFREMVLMVILDNPGIPESQIAKRVFEALRPVALHDILESLILDGCIVEHVRKLPSKRSLFSSSKQAEPTQTMTFYTPTIDCIFKLATIGPAIREFPHSNS